MWPSVGIPDCWKLRSNPPNGSRVRRETHDQPNRDKLYLVPLSYRFFCLAYLRPWWQRRRSSELHGVKTQKTVFLKITGYFCFESNCILFLRHFGSGITLKLQSRQIHEHSSKFIFAKNYNEKQWRPHERLSPHYWKEKAEWTVVSYKKKSVYTKYVYASWDAYYQCRDFENESVNEFSFCLTTAKWSYEFGEQI